MLSNHDPRTTSILLVDGSQAQRTYWANQLKHHSAEYLIAEVEDRESALKLYRSRRFDCVVLELALPDQLGFQLLLDLIPIPTRPQVAVIVLTQMTQREVWDLAILYGAYVCLAKQHTTGSGLDNVIQRALASVDQMPKEDRLQPI